MTIAKRILLLILIVTSVITLANFLLTRYHAINLHKDSEKLLAHTVVQSLRDALADDVINGNKLRVTNLLRSLKSHDNPIEYLYVAKGIQHSVFAHSFDDGFPKYLVENNDHFLDGPGIHLINKYQTEHGLIYEYSELLIPGLDTALHIGINQTEILKKLSRNFQLILGLSIIITIPALLVAYLSARQVSTPLTHFINQIKQYGSGGKITFSELKNIPPEIHQLSTVFQSAITERQKTHSALKNQQEFLQSVIDGIHDLVVVIDQNYQVKLMNNSVSDSMTTSNIFDINQPKCYEVTHHRSTPCDGKDTICPLKEVIETQNSVTVIHHYPDLQGNKRYMEVSATPLWDHDHNFIGVIELSKDITDHLLVQHELQEQKHILSYQANYDTLTKLPNRLLFFDRLNQTLKKAKRNNKKVTILFIDLDHFKEINDSLGHNSGDEVLKEAAKRIQLCVRESDTVSRLGGDEFTIIIDEIKDDDIITIIATKIIQALQQKFLLQEHELYVTSSIGISVYPDDAESAEDLLRNADAAMYKAKEEGRNTYHFYTEDMTQRAFEHITIEKNLRHALKYNELTVYYQPQVCGKTHQIMGMEALVRWQHPEQGFISPAKFIPLAEKTGLIIPLGEQVFDLATKQMADWMSNHKISGRMAINLSVKQLLKKNIVEVLLESLKENHCKPEWIALEITENYIMENPDQAIATLQKLQDIGIEIAIDDFGTGYSSLSYLKRLPINKLKIDQSFVRDVMKNDDDKAIITSIISLANNMNLDVIAEGVETSEEREFLLEQGCELIQGYYYSRPVPEKEMTELLISSDWK